MTFFAFSLYFRLLPTFYSSSSIQLSLFGVFPLHPLTNIAKQIPFLTLPKRCWYASNLFLQNIPYKHFFLLFKKGAGTRAGAYRHKKALLVNSNGEKLLQFCRLNTNDLKIINIFFEQRKPLK